MFNKLIPFSVLAFVLSVNAQSRLDGIAAVVGDEIILQSELDAYAQLRFSNLGLKSDSIDVKKYQLSFLNEIIDGKILLVHGKKDSTIAVTNEEVDQATNNHIAMLLKQNNLSLDSLEVELKRQQGITLQKFKTDARKIIKEQLIKQKVQQAYLLNTKITKKEVEQFYNLYKDSLPQMGESVLLSKLSMTIKPSEKIRQKAFEKIKSIKQRLDNGTEFEECAKKYSESPEGADGGDLGFIVKGTLNEISFEEKAFNLSPGQISEPFESRFGFHILKIIERRDQKVHLKQILIKVEAPQEEIAQLSSKLDSIRQASTSSADFVNFVKKFSTDQSTLAKNGSLGWVQVQELPASLKSIVDSLKTGEISPPVKNDLEISLYRLDDKAEKRSLTLENDFLILENKAKDISAQKKLISLVNQWRKNIYIDIRTQ